MCAGACYYFSPSKPHSGTLWRVIAVDNYDVLLSILQCRPSSNVLMSINREGDNGNNHINIIIIIKLLSHVHTMTTPPLCCLRVFHLTSEDLNLSFECWAGSWVSWGALANILLFLSFFLISGERENEERLFCHYINFLFDSWTRRYQCPTSATFPGTQLEQKSSSHGKQLWRLWPVLARAAPSWTQHRL